MVNQGTALLSYAASAQGSAQLRHALGHQFACEECLDIIGPKGELKHVRILGPERSATQIELAQTDCRNIGIKAPVRSSGDTKGTPGVTLRGPNGTLTVPEGVMIADRHIHMTPAQAAAYTRADVVARHDGILFGAEHRLHQQELIAYKLRHFAGGDNGPLDDP